MPKQKLSVQRLVFLFIIVAVFLYTYLADLNIFAAVLEILSVAAPIVKIFAMLFLVLSFASLSVYYYLIHISNKQISQRFLAWLKVFTWACCISFLVSALIVYLNIYCIKTFDNT